MSYFDKQNKPRKSGRRASAKGGSDTLWNVLTVLLLFLAIGMAGFFLSIFVSPYSALNPLPPPTLPPILTTPTATWTPRALGPTWTAAATNEMTNTATLRPSLTPVPSATPFLIYTETATPKPTNTRTPTKTPKPIYAFTATVTAYDSTIVHPESGCAWQGIGGTVVDMKGNPIIGLIVRLGGFYAGSSVDLVTVSGIAPIYGQGAFEFVLGTAPIATKNTLHIQLFDQAGVPLSDRISFPTYAECGKNLIIVRFSQVR